MRINGLLLMVILLGVTACQEEGPGEQIGAEADRLAGELQERAQDAADALQDEGPAERAGAQVDRLAGDIQDRASDAVDALQDTATDVRNAVEDLCEDATDRDC